MNDRIMSGMMKAMVVLCAVAVSLSLLAEVLRSLSTFDLIVAGTVISIVAYFIRESRSPRHQKLRNTSSGERTPVMPRRNP